MNRKTICPNCGCGHDVDPIAAGITVESLKKDCNERGLSVLAGDRITPRTAAALSGKSEGTLKAWRIRHGQDMLPFYRMGAGRGSVYYKLADLAEFFEK